MAAPAVMLQHPCVEEIQEDLFFFFCNILYDPQMALNLTLLAFNEYMIKNHIQQLFIFGYYFLCQ